MGLASLSSLALLPAACLQQLCISSAHHEPLIIWQVMLEAEEGLAALDTPVVGPLPAVHAQRGCRKAQHACKAWSGAATA